MWQYITLTKRIYLIDCPGIVPTSNSRDSETGKVLKGVVRVEALPTPVDHVPALMDRVKPLYLSRTYGVPLPDSDDPSKSWEPEVFMNKLARMKGRLLKGGEPDLNSVAKIILSDWTRGRIPFFVAPPERPEELNKLEEAKRKKLAGKQRAVNAQGEKQVPGVKQNLGSIMQKNTFLAEDIQTIEDDGEAEAEDEIVDKEEAQGDQSEEEEEELTWNDVWDGIQGDAPAAQAGEASESEGDAVAAGTFAQRKYSVVCLLDVIDVSDSASEDEEKPGKDPRMKTNKVCDSSL